MHELALCGAIADIVDKRADGRRVDTVRLRVGQLRQVVPDTLVFCWHLVTETTPLAGSALEIDHVAARVRCDGCASEHDLGNELDFGCPQCGGVATDVVSGEEFLVVSIDVAPAVAR